MSFELNKTCCLDVSLVRFEGRNPLSLPFASSAALKPLTRFLLSELDAIVPFKARRPSGKSSSIRRKRSFIWFKVWCQEVRG